jgi:CheY-like chemotaxis protein
METILVVDPDRAEAGRLRRRLEGSGFVVRHVATAFEALTLIERESPGLVLSRWNAGEMTACELIAAMRLDDAVEPFKAVLILEPGIGPEMALGTGTFDLVVDTEDLDALEAELDRLLDRPAHASADEAAAFVTISGYLDFHDLADLLQTMGSRGKTGTLELVCDGHMATISFDAGLVRHAGYRGAEGKSAFARLFAELHDCRRASFSFAPRRPAQLAAVPRTIDQPAQALLIEVAVAQDERRHRVLAETARTIAEKVAASGQDFCH